MTVVICDKRVLMVFYHLLYVIRHWQMHDYPVYYL